MNRHIAISGLVVLLVAATTAPLLSPVPTAKADEKVRQPSAEVRALRQQRLGVLKEIVELNMEAYRRGEQDFQAVANSQLAMMEAELQLAADQKTRIKVLESTLELTRHMQEMAESRARVGQGRQVDVLEGQAFYLQAKATLLQERSQVR